MSLQSSRRRGGEDRAIFALFVVLLRTWNLDFDKDENEFTKQFHRWWAKAKHPSVGATAQEVFEMVRGDQYEIRNHRQNNIKNDAVVVAGDSEGSLQLKLGKFSPLPNGARLSRATILSPFCRRQISIAVSADTAS